MSTIQRRRGKSLHLELPGGLPDDRPPIVALFLIRFDVKAGYTISWKKSLTDITLSDSVEFKSLPSGLHNVKEDLVYFMHDDNHAGISAFVNKSTDKYERNALMLAVGALVPLENGRLGRSWKHADKLKELVDELVLDPSNVQILEEYWSRHHLEESEQQNDPQPGSSSHSPADKSRDRSAPPTGLHAISTGLSPYHPALALPSLINAFGPLIFPLYKAALLRKRVLIMHEAPVQLACNYVYNISILSNIPSSVVDLIPLEPLPTRLQPLFSVGVHDIDELAHRGHPELGSIDPGFGWIACSTDDVLTMKTNIYDVLVTLPTEQSVQTQRTNWPHVRNAAGEELKASQRDLRRSRTLRESIRRHFPPTKGGAPSLNEHGNDLIDLDEENEDETSTLIQSSRSEDAFDDASSINDELLIEPMSWSALAYSSFMWWASAGEKTAGLEEEIEHDSSMFRDFNASSYADTLSKSLSSSRRRSSAAMSTNLGSSLMTDGSQMAPEMAIIAFFHRLTADIFATVAKAVEESSSGSDQDGAANNEGAVLDDDDSQSPVYIRGEDLIQMGLDAWSDADKKFVEELVELYWGRKAHVQGGTIECCGVRII